jgi:hypothetical protein
MVHRAASLRLLSMREAANGGLGALLTTILLRRSDCLTCCPRMPFLRVLQGRSTKRIWLTKRAFCIYQATALQEVIEDQEGCPPMDSTELSISPTLGNQVTERNAPKSCPSRIRFLMCLTWALFFSCVWQCVNTITTCTANPRTSTSLWPSRGMSLQCL